MVSQLDWFDIKASSSYLSFGLLSPKTYKYLNNEWLSWFLSLTGFILRLLLLIFVFVCYLQKRISTKAMIGCDGFSV